jgi:hypothetical protein
LFRFVRSVLQQQEIAKDSSEIVDKYEFTAEEREIMEGLKVPFAVYQFIDRHVVTLILSDGFCDLFGYNELSNSSCYWRAYYY